MLKLSREDLDMHRRHGASMRTPTKDLEPRSHPIQSQPEAAPIDTHKLGMEKLAQVVSDVVRQAVSQARPQQSSRPAPTYRFEVKRNDRGYIEEIVAHPID